MKKIEIQNILFNNAVKSVKGSIALDDCRPILKRIKVEIDEKFMKFISLDGYCATIYKVEHKCENVESFSFTFNAFNVEEDKRGIHKMTIEKLDNAVKFTYLDNNKNEITRVVSDFNQEFVNYNLVFDGNRSENSNTIGFQTSLLIKILKNFQKHSRFIKITFDKDSSIKPIFIKQDNKSLGEIESIVLPTRFVE